MRLILAASCLLILAGCAHKPEVIEIDKPVAPPEQYLQECVAKLVPVRVNGDLVRNTQALKTALKLCNADKAALRAWSKAVDDGDLKDALSRMASEYELKVRD